MFNNLGLGLQELSRQINVEWTQALSLGWKMFLLYSTLYASVGILTLMVLYTIFTNELWVKKNAKRYFKSLLHSRRNSLGATRRKHRHCHDLDSHNDCCGRNKRKEKRK